jgi:hypothetical protein
MLHSSAAPRPLGSLTQPPWYSDDLLPELQVMLAILADIEMQFQADRERLDTWAGPEAIKTEFAAQLEERRQQAREPYLQRLADLHDRMIRIMTLEDICSNP